jgi:hypothetical protein
VRKANQNIFFAALFKHVKTRAFMTEVSGVVVTGSRPYSTSGGWYFDGYTPGTYHGNSYWDVPDGPFGLSPESSAETIFDAYVLGERHGKLISTAQNGDQLYQTFANDGTWTGFLIVGHRAGSDPYGNPLANEWGLPSPDFGLSGPWTQEYALRDMTDWATGAPATLTVQADPNRNLIQAIRDRVFACYSYGVPIGLQTGACVVANGHVYRVIGAGTPGSGYNIGFTFQQADDYVAGNSVSFVGPEGVGMGMAATGQVAVLFGVPGVSASNGAPMNDTFTQLKAFGDAFADFINHYPDFNPFGPW